MWNGRDPKVKAVQGRAAVASLIPFFFTMGMGNLVQAPKPCQQITKPVPDRQGL